MKRITKEDKAYKPMATTNISLFLSGLGCSSQLHAVALACYQLKRSDHLDERLVLHLAKSQQLAEGVLAEGGGEDLGCFVLAGENP
jgi:hypothetical protein